MDGVALDELVKKLKVKIIITDGSGESFYSAFTEGDFVRIIK